MSTFIVEEQRGKVRRITFNRPEKHNAMPPDMQEDFFGAVDAAMADAGTSVVVLSGAGRSFSSGADLKAAGAGTEVSNAPGDMVSNRARVDRWLRLWSSPKPLIAQVHGWCIGIANEIVGCCDLVVCGESAKLGMPEAREFALPPTLGFWPAKIGFARTKELLFTGRFVDGAEAVTLGLANRVVPDDQLQAAVDELADSIAEVPVALLSVTKQAVNNWAETYGVRVAALRGAEYHSIYHQASSWGERFEGGGDKKS
jgi:enoyl-CoA hydratase